MKKIVFATLLSGVFLGSALADDLLAKVSNGALTENSAGVKKLNEAEMAEVKGGYKIGSVNWYVYTYKTMPYRAKQQACRRPQTLKQPIYADCY